MFDWLRSMLGGKRQSASTADPARAAYQRGVVRGRYEAATTSAENSPLWQFTDYLSAKAANSFQVRRTLKIRSRYEGANNSYFRGMIDTWSNDLVGTGPRLQMRSGSESLDKEVEKRWSTWCRHTGFVEKLRTAAKALIQDGEGIGLLINNAGMRRTFGGRLQVNDPVQLDWQVIESDQMTTPDAGFINTYWVDGIVLDQLGNPVEYHVLRLHPGDLFVPQLNPLIYDKWQPSHVCHWFRKDRPGQVRGVPAITPALELFAQLRRYTKAVLTAAETAADLAVMLETPAPADGETDDPEPFEQMQLDRGVMVTLPRGVKASSFASAQPATTYEMFVRILLREIARCLQIPLNIAMGDSSGYNYSSGRLDHLGYHRQQKIDRSACEAEVLAKTFAQWYAEARLIDGYLPSIAPPAPPRHRWFWDETESIDPSKDASADAQQLANHTCTLADIYAERGEDWEEKIRQRAREVQLLREVGLMQDPAKPASGPAVAARAKRIRARRRFNGVPHATAT